MTRIHVLSTPLRHPLAQYYYFYNSPHIILCVVSVFNLIEGDETARGGGVVWRRAAWGGALCLVGMLAFNRLTILSIIGPG